MQDSTVPSEPGFPKTGCTLRSAGSMVGTGCMLVARGICPARIKRIANLERKNAFSHA